MNPTTLFFKLTLILLIVPVFLSLRLLNGQNLCEPEYSNGCGAGDGFTDFAFAEIENYGSDCANLNGTGWSQYLGLGPAILLPGETYDMTMQTGYSNQKVSVWIDFNNDFDLSADEQVLFDFELPQANQFFTAQITIPIDALPGQHYLRARTNWSGSCDDPCENYNYGEAEDYYVFIGDGNFGNLEGNISQFSGGSPVENAMISLFGEFLNYQTSSGADGYYIIENILAGEYQVVCSAEGYNEITDTVLIIQDVVITKNFQLTQPSISVSPQNVTVTIDQNNTTLEYLTLENTGNGPLNWSASLLILSEKSKDYLDLQFEYPTSGTSGEWGIESDGEFIYTTSWTSNQFLKYDQQGNFVESFTISGVTGIRDLAYDGMYFYGSAGIPVVFKMDFMNKELLATFDAPANVRSIAYNHDENIFYAGSWNDEIVVFDTAGTLINTLITGPVGGVYNGLAYDNVSPGGPFLWGYGAADGSQNRLVQMQLPAGNETGVTVDLEEVLNGSLFGAAGGLFTHPNLVTGKWTLGGLVQNQYIWGLELGDAQTWLSLSPTSGVIDPAGSDLIEIEFDATDLEAGIYNAQIVFNSFPNVGSPVVDIEMFVSEFAYILCNFEQEVVCTDVTLTWEMCPGGSPTPDSCYVFRNDEKLATVIDLDFTDVMIIPDSNFHYDVSFFIVGNQSALYPAADINVPVPENLEPENLSWNMNGNNFTLHWNTPSGCLEPLSYNIYMNGSWFGNTEDTSFAVTTGGMEFYVTAVYYFGESGPSETILITDINEGYDREKAYLFPNPASDNLYLVTDQRKVDVIIYTGRGEVIKRIKDLKPNTRIDISAFASGLYFVEIVAEHKSCFLRMVVQ